MFAVPGWAVSTQDLVQESSKPKANKVAGPSKKAPKRKRHLEDDRVTDKTNTTAASAKKLKQEYPIPTSQNQPQGIQDKTRTIPKQDKSAHGQDGTKHTRDGTSGRGGMEQKGKQRRDVLTSEAVSQTRRPATLVAAIPPPLPASAKLTPLQAKMRSKLTSARFRHLNETLYTTTSSEAMTLFTNSPDLFADYHAGFSQQVKDSWPKNPVDGYIQTIKTRGASEDSHPGKSIALPLPRRKTGSCTIADLGCGDAPLARGCQSQIKNLRLKFHNYDLHAANSSVTRADIANLPLRDGEADIAVFCLSLMGTNWISFVEEAWRILRGDGKGEVWVSEVKSRFGRVTRGRVVDNSVGKRRKPNATSNSTTKSKFRSGKDDDDDNNPLPNHLVEEEGHPSSMDHNDDETDVTSFIKVFTRRGFQLRENSVDKSNKMFVDMVFIKSGIPTAGKYQNLKWNGKQYVNIEQQLQMQREKRQQEVGEQQQRKKFIDKKGRRADEGSNEVSLEEESRVLKPCVYKIR